MNVTSFIDLIKKRRSVYPPQYNNKPITEEELNSILESANWAPNHKRTEPWRFKVLRHSSKNRLAAFLVNEYVASTPIEKQTERKKINIIEKCEQSSAIILICVQYSNLLPKWEELAATAMAVQNMWLTCTTLNVGSYWSSPPMIKNIDKFCSLDSNEECIGIFYMGKTDTPLINGQRSSIKEKVVFINK